MSQEIGSVGTAYVELQADLSALQSQFSEAVVDAGTAGAGSGQAFSQGMARGVNLAPVAAQLDLFNTQLNQITFATPLAGAQQMEFAFQEMGQAAWVSAAQIALAEDQVAESMKVAATGAAELSTELEATRQGFNRAGTEAQNLGMIMSLGVTAPLVGLGVAAIQSYADIDSLKRGLTAVAGSAEEASRQFADMQEVAKLPGLGLEEAVQATIRLQAFGFSASQSKDALLAFGNAIATVGGGKAQLDDVIAQLGRMAGAGQVLQRNLEPLIQQVPQVAGIITKAFGPEVLSQPAITLANLGVSGKEFVQTLVTELGKLPPVTGGVKNDIENMSDAVKISLAQVGEALAPAFHGITEIVVPAMQTLVQVFTSLPPAAQDTAIGLAAVAAVMGPLVLTAGFLSKAISDTVGLVRLSIDAYGTWTSATLEQAAAETTLKTAQAGTQTGTALLTESMTALGAPGVGALALVGVSALSMGAGLVVAANALHGMQVAYENFEASAKSAKIVDLLSTGSTVADLQKLGLSLGDVKTALTGASAGFTQLDEPTVGFNQHIRALADGLGVTGTQLYNMGYSVDQVRTAMAGGADATIKAATSLDTYGLGIKLVDANATGLTRSSQALIDKQTELKKTYDDAVATYKNLQDAQSRGIDVGNALALAHDAVTKALKDLNPQIAENEKAQKAATEALKADSTERNKQDQLLLTAFDQKKKALTDLEAVQKEATQAGRDDLDFSAQLQTAKDALKVAFDNLNLAVQQNYVEQLAANNGTKQASDVQEKQTDQIGKLQQATVDYTKATKDATQQQILHQIALTGSFNTVQNGITIFRDVGTAMQDAAKAGTLTWAEVQKSIISVRDSLVTVPSAIAGVTASIEVMRGQGIQKIQSLADSIGGLKTAFLSVTDAMNGTQAAVPQWVLNNTVAIVNGVHIVSDAAKALFDGNTALAQSQEKVAGAQQQVNTVMIAGQQVMVTSNTVTSSATSASQDLAKAAQEVAAGFTSTANASGAAVAGINKVAAAAKAARNAFDVPSTATGSAWTMADDPSFSTAGDPGFSMDAPINGAAGVSVTTDRSTVEATAIAHPGTFAFGAAAQMQYDDYIAAQEALGAANLAAAATIDTNTASVTANSTAVADSTKQADAATPTISDLTDQLWRFVDAGQGGSTAAADLRAQIAALQGTAAVASNAYSDATVAATSYGTAIQAIAATTVVAAAQTVAAVQATKAALGIVAPATTAPISTGSPAAGGSTAGLTISSPSTWYTTGGPPVQINIAAQTAAAVGQQVTMMLRSIGMN